MENDALQYYVDIHVLIVACAILLAAYLLGVRTIALALVAACMAQALVGYAVYADAKTVIHEIYAALSIMSALLCLGLAALIWVACQTRDAIRKIAKEAEPETIDKLAQQFIQGD